jgi:hypothetical protein
MVSRVFACSAFGSIPNFLRGSVTPELGEAEAGPAHGRSFPCPEGGILRSGATLCGGVAYRPRLHLALYQSDAEFTTINILF